MGVNAVLATRCAQVIVGGHGVVLKVIVLVNGERGFARLGTGDLGSPSRVINFDRSGTIGFIFDKAAMGQREIRGGIDHCNGTSCWLSLIGLPGCLVSLKETTFKGVLHAFAIDGAREGLIVEKLAIAQGCRTELSS